MDEHFYDNDFEKFLQQQVKHHRMYPSDAVWKGIYQQMHGHKRWPGLYFFAILVVALLTFSTVFIESQPIQYPDHSVAQATTLKYDLLDPVQTTARTIEQIKLSAEPVSSVASVPVYIQQDVVAHKTFTRQKNVAENYAFQPRDIAADETLYTSIPQLTQQPVEQQQQAEVAVQPVMNTKLTRRMKRKLQLQGRHPDIAVTATAASPTDQYLDEHPEEADRIAQQKLRTKPARWQVQFYIAPSMNYRVLVDELAGTGPVVNGPVAGNYGMNANKVIRYKPGMGIEFGIGAMYRVNDRLHLKIAAQYNVRQYNIEAYNGSTEWAKIAVYRGNIVDTIQALSRFRTNGYYGEAQLLNKYHQVSMPVGVEYTLLGGKRFGVNLGGTIQPTYTFGQSSYLLSADYKSYADGKSMLRRWNVNSSLEAMFTFRARTAQWRIGPQLRYQHLPNYNDAYPIREYLIDYGFKIGFTKTIR